jgi:hypothetical protein
LYIRQRTNLVEHLVALIENESLNIAERQLLVADKRVQTTGGSDNDVRIGLLAGKGLDILLDRGTTVEDGGLDVRQVLGETGVLVLDLVGELTGVAHDQDLAFTRDGLQLVKSGEDEDSGLTETGLGLAKNIDVQDSSRDANLLDCGSGADVRLCSMKWEAKAIRLARSVHPAASHS